ncbi:penicillin acylase family protein [Tenacibaculum xiamenense]|uniref:penicillin acylase family protein n=1 Tax=Tenacibaculum xiamenense TaxID=1261553 RepID=UPI0038934004
MNLLKRIFNRKIVISVFLLLIIGGFLFYKSLKPTYNGELDLKGISESVTVYFDEVGVPHINANNNIDAYTALGYVHAQDRLWQMELIRRIASGRLAEVFGKDMVRVDKFFSGLGIEEAGAKNIERANKSSESYKMALAYLNGINQFIENGPTPIEFYLVGVDKEEYTLKDIYNVFGYMAFSFAVAHRTDPMLTEVKEKLGENYLQELIGAEYSNLTLIKNQQNPELKADFAGAINDIMDKLPVSPFIGSNSWVIGGQKTKTGKVLFANDPHIGYSQPSVWYQSHIKTPSYEMYGFNLALTPFPLLGHNREYAYGMTMFENDDVDFYIEENSEKDDMYYKTKEGLKKYNLIDKRIKIKNEPDTTYQIKVSQHGPIMNGLIEHLEDSRPIAMQWIYTKIENDLLEASYRLSHSKSLSQFKEGAAMLHAPGLNVMYGDSKNNIAWFASGKLYKYRDSLYTKVFLDGASGKDEIIEYLDFKENPQAINPDWNYVYSANNQPDTIAGILYPGYYLPEDRARRIENLLDAKDDFSKEDVAKMIYDVTSVTAPEIIKSWLAHVDKSNLTPSEAKAMNILKEWDGYFGKDEIGPVLYNRMWYEFAKNTFKDEMGKAFNLFMNTPFEEKVVAAHVKREESVWWDDVKTTDKKETKKDIIIKSYKNAIAFLQNQLGENVDDWKWKRVASVEHEHAIGKAGGVLREIFNVGPFETVGGDQVINNHIYKIDSTGYYKTHAGPSTRRVIDFSDIENSITVIPTGQSGNVLSPYYKDQAEKYLNGAFVKMKLNQEEIESSKSVLIFKPN